MAETAAVQAETKKPLTGAWKTAALPDSLTDDRAACAFAAEVFDMPLADKISLFAASVDKVLDTTGNVPDLTAATTPERSKIYSAWCAALITGNSVTARIGAPDLFGVFREKDVMKQTETALILMADFAAAANMPSLGHWQQRLSWYKRINRDDLAEIVAPFSPGREIKIPVKKAAAVK